MQTSSVYRSQARESLQGRWSSAVVATLIVVVIASVSVACSTTSQYVFDWSVGFVSGFTSVWSLLVCAPLGYAFSIAILSLVRRDEKEVAVNMFSNFKNNYGSLLITSFLVSLLVGLLAVVTLGIAGIIFSYAYRMVPYLLKDYPTLSPQETMKTSREMMRGHKFELFLLDLSFIGWILLCILTLGIGVLWLEPYMVAATSHFYEDLKAEAIVDTDNEVEA